MQTSPFWFAGAEKKPSVKGVNLQKFGGEFGGVIFFKFDTQG